VHHKRLFHVLSHGFTRATFSL